MTWTIRREPAYVTLSDHYGELVSRAWGGKLSNQALIVLLVLARELKFTDEPDVFECLMYATIGDDSDMHPVEVYLDPDTENIARVFQGTPEEQRQQFSEGVIELIHKQALILTGTDGPVRRFTVNFFGPPDG